MMQDNSHPSGQGRFIRLLVWTVSLIILFTLTGCSTQLRLQNLFRIAVEIEDLTVLDTLKIRPDHARIKSRTIDEFRLFTEDLHLSADPLDRSTWSGSDEGCLRIENEAEIILEDMNFRSGGDDSVLIDLRSGSLTLINCELAWAKNWAINAAPGTQLILQDVSIRIAGSGAIRADSAEVLLFSSQIENGGRIPVHISNAEAFEAHHCSFVGGHETALVLENVAESWLDSVTIRDALMDGCRVNGGGMVLLNHVSIDGNGRYGLHAEDLQQLGILNTRFIRNQGTGIFMTGGDSLRILQSEVSGNNGHGMHVQQTGFVGIAGCRMIQNDSLGMVFQQLDSLLFHHSLVTQNDLGGMHCRDMQTVTLTESQFSGNAVGGAGSAGLILDTVERVDLIALTVQGNGKQGYLIQGSDRVRIHRNLVKGHAEHGSILSEIRTLVLKNNHFAENAFGLNSRKIRQIESDGNHFYSNQLGWSVASIDSLFSTGDTASSNTITGVELGPQVEGRIRAVVTRSNRTGISVSEAPIRIEDAVFSDNREVGLDLITGQLEITNSKWETGALAVKMHNGTILRGSQLRFNGPGGGIHILESAHAILNAVLFKDLEYGIKLGNYAHATVRNSEFLGMNGAVITALGPNLLNSEFSHNLFRENALILWGGYETGVVQIKNNTLEGNESILSLKHTTRVELSHNILTANRNMFQPTGIPSLSTGYNCYWQNAGQDTLSTDEESHGNFMLDPRLDEQFYLQADSPCLTGGWNGQLVGARGVAGEREDWLKP